MSNSGELPYRRSFVTACLAGANDSTLEWLAMLDEVANNVIAPAAPAVDRDGAYPVAAIEELRSIGAFGVQIPIEFGGLGCGDTVAALVVERIAQACPSTAAILMFHYQVVTRTLQYADVHRRSEDLRAMAKGHTIAASAWTEPSATKDKADVSTALRHTADGYRVDGVKTYCTGLRSATTIDVLLSARLVGEEGPTFVRIDTRNPGFTVAEIYEMLGLRGTSTGTIQLTAAQVARSDIVGPVGSGRELMRANHQTPLNPGLLALGIANAAFHGAVEMLAGSSNGTSPLRPPDNSVRRTVAESAVILEAAYGYSAETFNRMVAEPRSAHILSSKFKVQATSAADSIARRLMHAVGSRGFLAKYPLERHMRDAQATAFMGPTNDVCLERISTDILASH